MAKCNRCNRRRARPGYKSCEPCRRKYSAPRRPTARGKRPCSSCRGARDAAPGRRTCRPCLGRANRNTSARIGRRRERGLCPACGLRPPKPGRRWCGGCLKAFQTARDGRLADGLCACGGTLAEGRPQCEACWTRDSDWKRKDRARDRRAALRKLARGGAPKCAGWPGPCGSKARLEIDHIHDDGHLDLLPSGRRRGGASSVQRVLGDPTPWTWAQILCRRCNSRKAAAARKRGPERTAGAKPRRGGGIPRRQNRPRASNRARAAPAYNAP